MQILPVTLKKLVANDITIYWDINTVPINFDTDRLMVINADTKVMTITN